MRKRLVLEDGTVLVTASGCRFVTFVVGRDGNAWIVKRTDNPVTADKNHVNAHGARVVTVDFAKGGSVRRERNYMSASV